MAQSPPFPRSLGRQSPIAFYLQARLFALIPPRAPRTPLNRPPFLSRRTPPISHSAERFVFDISARSSPPFFHSPRLPLFLRASCHRHAPPSRVQKRKARAICPIRNAKQQATASAPRSCHRHNTIAPFPWCRHATTSAPKRTRPIEARFSRSFWPQERPLVARFTCEACPLQKA